MLFVLFGTESFYSVKLKNIHNHVTVSCFACIYKQKDTKEGINMTNTAWRKTASITKAAAPILIISGVLVKRISRSALFVTAYSRCAVVIVAAIVAFMCVRLLKMIPDEKISMPLRIGFCIASFFAIGQNLMFMAHGLYQSLTVFSTTGMTLAAIGSFLIIYAINTVITINGIRMFNDKPWGMIAPLMIACAGANLISHF